MDARSAPAIKSLAALWENAGEANMLLRSLANENRMMILCLLAEGERSVGEIEAITDARQPTISPSRH